VNDEHLVEEVINDIDFTEQVTNMRCVECGAEWELTEKLGQFHVNSSCPWCHTANRVPRKINGAR